MKKALIFTLFLCGGIQEFYMDEETKDILAPQSATVTVEKTN